jgi:molybdopterin converting factor small subunit
VASIKVLFFATLRNKTGIRSTELQIPAGTTLLQLKSLLVQKFPNLDEQLMEHCRASLNQQPILDEDQIPPASEIALYPPLSGG